MSRYTLSARAKLDIQLIWNYIAETDIDAADRVKAEIRAAITQLVRMPGMGHRRLDVNNPRYRFWTVFTYVIAYIPDAKPLHFVHGARNFKRLFK